jgi:hypothetical protein
LGDRTLARLRRPWNNLDKLPDQHVFVHCNIHSERNTHSDPFSNRNDQRHSDSEHHRDTHSDLFVDSHSNADNDQDG